MDTNGAYEIVCSVLAEIAPEIDPKSIDRDAELRTEVDIDSIDFLNVITAIHERTGVDIPERDYPRLLTLSGFAGYLADAVS